jgi:translation initiation factor 2B subunit (eIF-2B alpha/beta/delta family)
MAPIFNSVRFLLDTVSVKSAEIDLGSLVKYTIRLADEYVESSLQAIARITQYGVDLIAAGDRIMTHSFSSTVVSTLIEAHKQKGIEVVVTRSAPGCTGRKIVQQLGNYGVSVTFIDDTAAGLHIAGVNRVMLGADRVCADGKVINGVGSYQVAVMAERTEVPLFILCETLKFDPRLKSEKVDLEDRDVFELTGRAQLPEKVTVRNPHFDIVPLELIKGVITENGMLTPSAVKDCISKISGC